MRLVEDVQLLVSLDPYGKKHNGFPPIVLPRGHAVRESWRVVNTDNLDGDYLNEARTI